MTDQLTPITLAQQLVTRPSVTPADAGCQDLIAELLAPAGFTPEKLPSLDVQNLWATHGTGAPLFCFLGHTDVVPTGPESDWSHPPFAAVIENGHLWGRGSADMKGSIAAFTCAALDFVKQHPNHKGTLAILLTSDEEGPAIDGTQAVLKELTKRNQKIDWCLVGEPSSEEKLGDVIKVGRRGSLTGKLTVTGIQGHVAYPQLALNPIHQALPIVAQLCQKNWDNGNKFFPPTSFQISNIHAGTGADNVIPGKLELSFNFRFSSEHTPESLRQAVHSILDEHKLNYTIDWLPPGLPFITESGKLLEAICQAIEAETGAPPKLSTAGGTSDGRFVAPTGAQVIEFGPLNRTIHKINECVSLDDLLHLRKIYSSILSSMLL